MTDLPNRKRIRLPDYDYSQDSYYYVTVCTQDKRHLFGMGDHLTDYGLIAERCLHMINSVFPFVRIDKYVIMPNHIHVILVFHHGQTARMYACPTLGTVIGNYKAAVTREIHLIESHAQVWQKRFYDHIIRNQSDYEAAWTYIDENPVKWESDEYY